MEGDIAGDFFGGDWSEGGLRLVFRGEITWVELPHEGEGRFWVLL